MNIVIIGTGEIGFDLAQTLSSEDHNVVVLDNDKEALDRVDESMDVLTQQGSATSASDLVKANVRSADIVIAVTSIDEVNMIAPLMSKRLGAKMTIARVRNAELSHKDSPLRPTDLGIDVIIHPELSAAHEIVKLLKRSSASDIINLADGKMQLIGIRLNQESPLNNKTLEEYATDLDETVFRVVAIARGGRTIIPSGSTKLQSLDQVFILAETNNIPKLIESTGRKEDKIEQIMIAGGTPIGSMITRILSEDKRQEWNIKLIEPDLNRANRLADELPDVMVLNGNSTDPDLLAVEGIMNTDAFISVTDDEESNIISCLMAKHMKVQKTVALVSKSDYIPLSQTIGLDAAVNKKSSASNEIHRYVRRGRVISATALQGIKAEVIELQAGEKSKVTNKTLRNLKLPDGSVIGGILRNGSTEIATGNSQIQPNDRVIIFCLPQAVEKMTNLFK